MILGVLASGVGGIQVGLASTDRFLKTPEAVVGQQVLAKAFPAGSTSPTVVITNNDKLDAVKSAVEATAGVDAVEIGRAHV